MWASILAVSLAGTSKRASHARLDGVATFQEIETAAAFEAVSAERTILVPQNANDLAALAMKHARDGSDQFRVRGSRRGRLDCRNRDHVGMAPR